MVETKRSWSAT